MRLLLMFFILLFATAAEAQVTLKKRIDAGGKDVSYSLAQRDLDSLHRRNTIEDHAFYGYSMSRKERFMKWREDFIDRVLPEDFKQAIEECCRSENSPKMITGPVFAGKLLFDRTGKVVEVFLWFSHNYLEVLTEERLREFRESLMKEHIPLWQDSEICDSSSLERRASLYLDDAGNGVIPFMFDFQAYFKNRQKKNIQSDSPTE